MIKKDNKLIHRNCDILRELRKNEMYRGRQLQSDYDIKRKLVLSVEIKRNKKSRENLGEIVLLVIILFINKLVRKH